MDMLSPSTPTPESLNPEPLPVDDPSFYGEGIVDALAAGRR
jgi:hypothetical protein